MLDPYDLAVRELVLKFEHIKYEHMTRGIYCPIEQVTGRVKSIASILDKMQKKNVELADIETRFEDLAGVRIICQFVEDIPKVVQMIRERSDMKVTHEKNYIDHVKDSGYRSYHVIIDYEVWTIQGPKTVCAEIQVRTMGMNFWSTIEHSLQYKYKQNIPVHVKEKLSKCADAIVLLDSEMSSVRDEIMDAQNSMRTQEQLVEEILLLIQNLYTYANKREIDKIQDEFYEVYREKDMGKLHRFHKQLDIISEGYKAQSLSYPRV